MGLSLQGMGDFAESPEKNKKLINSRGPSKNFMWFHSKQGNNILGASNARIWQKRQCTRDTEVLRDDTGPLQIALRKVSPCDQYMRNLHAARYESPGLGAHCLLVWAHMPARAVPHGIASLAIICPAAAGGLPAWSCTARGGTARHGARKWRRHVKECSDDLAAGSEQVQDLCCGLRNVNPLACRYRHDHPPATSLASITNSWQHGAAQRVPCLSMEGSRCAKGIVYSLSLNR